MSTENLGTANSSTQAPIITAGMDESTAPPVSQENIEYNVGLDEIREIEKRSYEIMDRLRNTVFAPDKQKRLNIRFNIKQASEMVNRTSQTIRDAEKNGQLPPAETNAKGKRSYTLERINEMRAYFGTKPWRADDEEPILLSVQNFKGGVAKSTTACHLAQYLALKGYRVCLVDCDSQATSTTLFGYNPDDDLSEEDTLLPFLMHGKEKTLHYALKKTYWDGISLIPANLWLYEAEYQLGARAGKTGIPFFDRLKEGLDTIKDQFDVIIIDPPPALGMISLSVLRAANAMIIPVPPSIVDFSSTVHFFTMLADAMETLEKYGSPASYKFVEVLATKVNEKKSAQTEIAKMMSSLYGEYMLDAQFKDSAEIDNASAQLQTVYELATHATSRDTHKRCKAYLNSVNGEIELLIRKTWPSHRQGLRDMGLI